MENPNYKVFLDILQDDLLAIFEHQKEYVCCKEGCSLCCESGNYPITELESLYLKEGFNTLDLSLQDEITSKIKRLKETPQEMYECPFLINKRCSVYEYRPLICRTFGVLSSKSSGGYTVPFCQEEGLNYADVYIGEKRTFDWDKIKEKGYIHPPRPFNLSLKSLIAMDIVKELGLEFGEIKKMIDYL